MINCNINLTNPTNCKKKISKDNTENQCQKCQYFFCKQHQPRHKCQPQKENSQDKQEPKKELEKQQQQQQKIEESVQENAQKITNNKITQQQQYPTVQAMKDTETKDNKEEFKIKQINYKPEGELEAVISNEVIYDKKGKLDQEQKYTIYQQKYQKSQIRQLQNEYVLNNDDYKNRGKNKKGQQYKKKQNVNEEQKVEEFPDLEPNRVIFDKQQNTAYDDLDLNQDDQSNIQKLKPKPTNNNNNNNKNQEQQQQQKAPQKQQTKQQNQQETQETKETNRQQELKKKIQQCLLALNQKYKTFKEQKDTEILQNDQNYSNQQQQQQQEFQQNINQQQQYQQQQQEYNAKNIEQINHDQIQLQEQEKQKDDEIVIDSNNLFEVYTQRNQERQKALMEYINMIDQEIKESMEIGPQEQKQQEIFDNIDKEIKFKDTLTVANIKIPGKKKEEYNFKSIIQEQQYQKKLPIEVPMPVDPYELQQDFVYKILNALDNPQEENILIESPSGTGKTLSLLCSTLAFLKKQRETKLDKYRYQIVYASKTYSQLQQVANELKKTGYDIRCTILGSQQEMCVNQEVVSDFFQNSKKQQKTQNFALYCQTSCRNGRCQAQKNSNIQMEKVAQQRKIIDIEEIDKQTMNFNNRTSTCPYFNARNNIDTQDLILVPYDIILDERGIKRLGKIPKRLLIIFDEAHNVLEEACKGSSYKLDMTTLQKVLDYVQKVNHEISQGIEYLSHNQYQMQQDYYKTQKMIQIQQLKYYLSNAQIFGYDQYQQESIQNEIKVLESNSLEQFQQQQLTKMKDILKSVYVIQDTLNQTYSNFNYEIEKNHNKKQEKYKLADTYPRMISKLFQREEDEIKLINLLKSLKKVRDYSYMTRANNKNSSLAQMAPFEDLIFFFHSLLLSVKKNPKFYKLMAQFTEQGYLTQPIKNMEYTLQCFEPELALKKLLVFPKSHFILTSGQLTPFESFLKEFSKLKHLKSMPFQTHLFKNHVISKQNFFGRILNMPPMLEGKKKKEWQCFFCKTFNESSQTECSKDGCTKSKPSWLKFTRKATENYDNKNKIISKEGQKLFEELGMYFEKLVDAIPGGLILIFPSLNLMEKCRYAWVVNMELQQRKLKKYLFNPEKNMNISQLFQNIKNIQKNMVMVCFFQLVKQIFWILLILKIIQVELFSLLVNLVWTLQTDTQQKKWITQKNLNLMVKVLWINGIGLMTILQEKLIELLEKQLDINLIMELFIQQTMCLILLNGLLKEYQHGQNKKLKKKQIQILQQKTLKSFLHKNSKLLKIMNSQNIKMIILYTIRKNLKKMKELNMKRIQTKLPSNIVRPKICNLKIIKIKMMEMMMILCEKLMLIVIIGVQVKIQVRYKDYTQNIQNFQITQYNLQQKLSQLRIVSILENKQKLNNYQIKISILFFKNNFNLILYYINLNNILFQISGKLQFIFYLFNFFQILTISFIYFSFIISIYL